MLCQDKIVGSDLRGSPDEQSRFHRAPVEEKVEQYHLVQLGFLLHRAEAFHVIVPVILKKHLENQHLDRDELSAVVRVRPQF